MCLTSRCSRRGPRSRSEELKPRVVAREAERQRSTSRKATGLSEERSSVARGGADMHHHNRRQFLQGSLALAGLILLSSREVAGQQPAKVPRIGFLAVGSREGRAFLIEGFRQGEGRPLALEPRDARRPSGPQARVPERPPRK